MRGIPRRGAPGAAESIIALGEIRDTCVRIQTADSESIGRQCGSQHATNAPCTAESGAFEQNCGGMTK